MTRTGDELLVASAARRLGVQVAAIVAVAMLTLVALVAIRLVQEQRSATDSLLRSSASTADDVGDPPRGTWLVLDGVGGLRVSAGLPASVQHTLTVARRTSLAVGDFRFTSAHGGSEAGYRVLTMRRGPDELVQAVADLTVEHRQREQVIQLMVITMALALTLSSLLGCLIGHRAVRPLAKALALQRTFVADASHELRTPLTLLSTRAQVLARSVHSAGLSDELRADADGVVNDARRLGEVVDDLLAAADTRSAVDESDLDVRTVVRDAVASVAAHASAASVQVVEDVGSEALVVRASAAGLRRALLALLDNAVDHTPAGGAVTVTTSGRRTDVLVTVADSGPGVDPADRARLFTRFGSGGHRAGRTNYGLGLALAHDLANRYGGHLRLVPSASGAVFELRLPRLAPRKP